MNDNTVCCQNVSATEPQRDPRRPKWTGCRGANPYRFLIVALIFFCRGGVYIRRITIPPSFSCENATSLYTREAFVWFSPYYWVLPFLIVGDDILGVPYAWRNVTLTSQAATRPALLRGEPFLTSISLKAILHKASPFRRGGGLYAGEVYRL